MPQTSVPTLSFLDELTASLAASASHRRISPDLNWLMLTNGDSDPFDSVILFGFEGSQADPSLVAKVPRMPENDYLLEVEYRSLTELWSLLGPEAAACLPEPVAFVTLEHQPALVIGYVKGASLMQSSGRGFWSDEKRALPLFTDAARALRRLNDRASLPLAAGEFLPSRIDLQAARFNELFTLHRGEQDVLTALVRDVQSALKAATRKVLVQGDFWHGNLIRDPARRDLIFVDWQFAHWSADVSIDVYLFLMAAALTAAPYGKGPERARGAAAVLRSWRSSVIPAYLAAYGRPEGYLCLPPRLGMLATCVEKAVRPALDFGYSHPDDLMWRLLFAELVNWTDEDWMFGAEAKP